MKKISAILTAIAITSLTMAATTAKKHINTEPDNEVTEVFDADTHGREIYNYDCPEFSEADIQFLKQTWHIMVEEFVETGALDMELHNRPAFWNYWLIENMANHREDGYGYWNAILVCYETAEFADMFDDDNHKWIQDFKKFGLRKQIAFEQGGAWYAYEY